jgi:hypothetical protein
MSTRTSRWPAGVPRWVDLATTDVAAARDFYGAVLGWLFRRFKRVRLFWSECRRRLSCGVWAWRHDRRGSFAYVRGEMT